jgi:hypothetical protein
MGDDHPTQRRRGYNGCTQVAQLRRQLQAQLFCNAWVLEDQRALDVAVTVQTGGEDEVTFEQRRVLAKDLKDFVFSHMLRAAC